MRPPALILCILSLASAQACFSLPGSGPRGSSSCDFRTATPPEQGCTDYTSVASGQTSFNTSCSAGHGTVQPRCPHAGALGGCTILNTDGLNNEQTDWYYPDTTVTNEADVRAKCAAEGSTFTPA